METPQSPPPVPPLPTASPLRRWLFAAGLLLAGAVAGMVFAAYGGADLLVNFGNLRYCG